MRLLLLAALGFSMAGSAFAQPYVKASEKAMVAQTVDGTTITVEYSRPAARGRKIFGALVKFGETWTPGANWATTLELSRDAKVAGEKVAAGKYSVWTIPGEHEWTVLLHEDSDRFHLRKPKPEECRYKLTATPSTAHHMESLAFYFDAIGPGGTALNLHWGDTVVALPIEVEPTYKITKLTDAEAAPYLGRYIFQVHNVAPEPIEMNLTIVAVEGELRGYMGAKESIQLIPSETKNRFLFADLREGRVSNVQDTPAIFEIGGDGRATGFELRYDPAAGVRLTGNGWISGRGRKRSLLAVPRPSGCGFLAWAGVPAI